MKRKLLYIGGILLVCCMLVAIGMTMRLNEEITTPARHRTQDSGEHTLCIYR